MPCHLTKIICEKLNLNHVYFKSVPIMKKMGKNKSLKRKLVENEERPEDKLPPAIRSSDEPVIKKTKWTNKQRVLVFSTRGICHRDRHLMEDLKKIMPHHKPEPKMERSKNLFVVNEMCEIRNCNKALMFEGRKKKDLYVWMSNVPKGPSAKFLVQNVYTMAELKLTGNCLRGSRPLLSFDPSFNDPKLPHYGVLKELFTGIFNVPKHHPKSQPFFDHVYTFTVLDNRIWFRNFQILSEDGALAEIGPRMVFNPVKIFSGSFGGQTLWENPKFVTPAKIRHIISKKANNKYINRKQQKVHAELTKPKRAYGELDPLNDIFKEDTLKLASKLAKKKSKSTEDDQSDTEKIEDENKPQEVTTIKTKQKKVGKNIKKKNKVTKVSKKVK